MTAIFYILCGTYYLAIVSSQDPCTNNRELSQPTRSVEYSLAPTDPDLCDRIITEGWYRIPENGNIPTECPPILRCGSTSPIWLNGTLPTTTGTTVTLSACQRGFIQCCDLSFPIDVHNCGGFNVFRLTATPACPGRYCTVGPPAPCPPGMSSDSGFEPCQRLEIRFSVTPKVEPFIPTYEPTSPQNELAFRCKTSMPAKYHGYVFDIAWYINNNQVALKERIPYTSLNNDEVLHRLDWDPGRKARIGFRIECAMRARQSAVSVPTPYKTSDDFFAGATIRNKSFSVKAGDEVKILLQSTVPIACKNIHGRSSCDVRIEMFSFQDEFESAPAHCNDSVTEKIKPAMCGTTMNGINWNHYHNITVHTLADQSSRRSYTCSVNLQAKSFTDTLWLNYKLPEVMIHVSSENRPAGTCYTQGEPHIKTFDGVQKYTTHEKGEFVIYKHRKKPIEVNTIHKWVGGRGSFAVNCAIAIRAAADVFIIYGCGTRGSWIIKRLNCDNEHQYLDIYERGKDYEVVLPTGTRIKIYIRPYWLNIFIYISGSDWNQTDGLCGTYNGNRDDDFTNREGNIVSKDDFIKSWGVPRVHSLYVAKSRKDRLATQVMYCSCFNETLVGSSTSLSTKANCQWQESLPLCQPLNWKENKCQIHGKRQTDDDLEIDVPFDIVDFAEGPKEFTWTNGWTEEKAVNACTFYTKQSKLFNICSKLANVDFDVKLCVSDIKISGTDEFLSSSLDTMKSSCLNEVRVNTTFWKKKTPKETTTATTGISSRTTKSDRPMTTKSTIQPEVDIDLSSLDLQSLSDAIFDVDCPDDCSNVGTCNQGVCQCDEGYTEDDCSVNTMVPPDVFGISEESLCDVIKRPCSSVSLFGTGFYHSDSVMCQIVQAKMQEEDIIPGNFNQTVDGILATFGEVKCPLSEITLYSSQTPNISIFDIYLIAVSFNMVDFSNQSPIIVYDGNCTRCQVKDGKPHCVDKKDICRIDGKCYNKEDGICNVNGNTEMDGGINYIQLWTIGAALGGISIVIIPALLIIKR